MFATKALKRENSSVFPISIPSMRVAVLVSILALPIAAPDQLLGSNLNSHSQTSNVPSVDVSGKVLDDQGRPMAKVKIKLRFRDRFEATQTDEQGQFSHPVPRNELYNLLILASSEDGKLQASARVVDPREKTYFQNLKLKLSAARVVRVQVKNANGMVATETTVGILASDRLVILKKTDGRGSASILVPQQIDSPIVFAFSPASGYDYSCLPIDLPTNHQKTKPLALTLAKTQSVKLKVVDIDDSPVPRIPVCVASLRKPGQRLPFRVKAIPELATEHSNENGLLSFDWIPEWQELVSCSAMSSFHTDYSVYAALDNKSKTHVMTVFRKEPFRGKIVDVSGNPVGNLKLRFHGSTNVPRTRRSMIDAAETYTDKNGRFEVLLAPYHFYLGFCQGDQYKFSHPVEVFVNPEIKKPEIKKPEFKWTVHKGTRIFGQVTFKANGKPAPNQRVWVTQSAVKTFTMPHGGGSYRASPALAHTATTDKNGRYELVVGAGKFGFQVSNQTEVKRVLVKNELSKELNFSLRRLGQTWLTGTVVNDETGLPIKDANIEGVYADSLAKRSRFKASTDKEGKFKVERESLNTVLVAKSLDSKWAVLKKLDADTKHVELRLKKTINASGTLTDESGKPLANKELIFGRDVYKGPVGRSPFSMCFGGMFTTGDKGEFRMDNILPGNTYQLRIITEKEEGIPMAFAMISEISPKPGDTDLKLGPLVYRERRIYRPPTIKERVAKSFNVKTDIGQRMLLATQTAKISRQRVLMLLGDVNDPNIHQLFKWKHEDTEVKTLTHGFVWMSVNYHNGSDPKTIDALNKLKGIKVDSMKREPTLFFLDDQGTVLESLKLSSLIAEKQNQLDKSSFIRVLTEHTPKPLDGKKLLADALARAKKENKRVIVQHTATWCGPCVKLSRFLDRTRDHWNGDYIWVKMDSRWTHATEIMTDMRDGAPGGIPWFAILDSSGKKLTTSNPNHDEDNIGFPSSLRGQAHFKKMILDSKIRLTEKQVKNWIENLNSR